MFALTALATTPLVITNHTTDKYSRNELRMLANARTQIVASEMAPAERISKLIIKVYQLFKQVQHTLKNAVDNSKLDDNTKHICTELKKHSCYKLVFSSERVT